MLHIGPWTAEFLGAGHYDLVPFIQHGVYGGGADVLEGKTSILKLEIPAGGERLEGFGDDKGGVFETCEKGAAMNEVEGIAECPFVFGVVDLETAVWRDALFNLSTVI
jgi:hypothetical protein